MKLTSSHHQGSSQDSSFFTKEGLTKVFEKLKLIDYWILLIYFIFVCISIVLVYSTSQAFSLRNFQDPRYLFNKHLIGIILALVALVIGYILSDNFFKKYNILISTLIIVLLIAPLIPGVGLSVGGSSRWVKVWFINFQPSEIVKVLSIFYLSYQIGYKNKIQELSKEFIPTAVFISLSGLLILLQKDFSTSLIFFATTLLMLYMNNFSYKDLFKIVTVGIIALLPFILFSSYRLERITMFFSIKSDPAFAYQVTQSINALNKGGLLGLGPGQGNESIPYVFNDFIFASIGEEFGFIGGLIILLLFFVLIQRSIRISKALFQQSDHYSALIIFGIAMSFATQTIINIAVNLALIFPTGITLPFLSYGRTSLIVSSFCIGILLKYSQKIHKTI